MVVLRNNYMQELIYSIRAKWDTLTYNDKVNVVAAISRLNKHGEVEKELQRER